MKAKKKKAPLKASMKHSERIAKIADYKRALEECNGRISEILEDKNRTLQIVLRQLRKLSQLICEDMERSGDKTTFKNETVLEILRSQTLLNKLEVLPHIPGDITQ